MNLFACFFAYRAGLTFFSVFWEKGEKMLAHFLRLFLSKPKEPVIPFQALIPVPDVPFPEHSETLRHRYGIHPG